MSKDSLRAKPQLRKTAQNGLYELWLNKELIETIFINKENKVFLTVNKYKTESTTLIEA